jgi:hypothetical protein
MVLRLEKHYITWEDGGHLSPAPHASSLSLVKCRRSVLAHMFDQAFLDAAGLGDVVSVVGWPHHDSYRRQQVAPTSRALDRGKRRSQ